MKLETLEEFYHAQYTFSGVIKKALVHYDLKVLGTLLLVQ
jgi:hypothetical protein